MYLIEIDTKVYLWLHVHYITITRYFTIQLFEKKRLNARHISIAICTDI